MLVINYAILLSVYLCGKGLALHAVNQGFDSQNYLQFLMLGFGFLR